MFAAALLRGLYRTGVRLLSCPTYGLGSFTVKFASTPSVDLQNVFCQLAENAGIEWKMHTSKVFGVTLSGGFLVVMD